MHILHNCMIQIMVVKLGTSQKLWQEKNYSFRRANFKKTCTKNIGERWGLLDV